MKSNKGREQICEEEVSDLNRYNQGVQGKEKATWRGRRQFNNNDRRPVTLSHSHTPPEAGHASGEANQRVHCP